MFEKKELQGQWISKAIEKVENQDSNPLYVKRNFTFKDDQWQVILITYANPLGNHKLFTARAHGTYYLGKESSYVDGAREVEFHSIARFMTPHQESVLNLLRHACQTRNWEMNQEEDVSKYGCLSVPSVEKHPIEYDLLKLDDNMLYFGDYTSDQKKSIQAIGNEEKVQPMEGIFSIENRPQKIISDPLIKN